MTNMDKALKNLNRKIAEREHGQIITFEDFLTILSARPVSVVRNVFQTFHDMIRNYVGEGEDEYPYSPESINYVNYDCSRLFIENTDRPFFCGPAFRQPAHQPCGRHEDECAAEQDLYLRGPTRFG